MSQGHHPAGGDASDAESGAVASSGAREVTDSTAAPPVDVGDVIDGRYELRDRLGAGGMGYVFGGIDRRLRRPVAVKVIRSELAENRSMARRFEREALASSQLTSPYVVVVYDFGTTDAGVPYLVMERLIGQTLSQAIKRAGVMPVEETLGVAADVARALVAAHGRGIVHRDLKPDNVFLTDAGQAKVLDFGIAKILQPDGGFGGAASLTSTGMMLGTPLYMSPESVRKKSDVGPPSDMYSVGSILFRMLTGRPVFVHDEPVVVLSMHVQRTPPKLSEIRRDLAFPEALEELVDALLAKDPTARPNASETLERLEAIAREIDRAPSAPPEEGTPLHEVATAVLQMPEARAGAEGVAAAPSMATDAFEPPAEPTAQTPAPPMAPADPGTSASAGGPLPDPSAGAWPAPLTPAYAGVPSPPVARADDPAPAAGVDQVSSGTEPPSTPPVEAAPGDARASVPMAAPPAHASPSRRRPPIGLFFAVGATAFGLALVGGVVWLSSGSEDDEPTASELTATELPRAELPRPATERSDPRVESGARADAPAEVEDPAQEAEPPRAAEHVADEPPEPIEEQAEARPTAPRDLPAAAPPTDGPGRLVLQTDVPAEVSIDGARRGSTPLDLELPSGRHRVVLEAGGRRRALTVDVDPGDTVRRRVALSPRSPSPPDRTADEPSSGLPELPTEW